MAKRKRRDERQRDLAVEPSELEYMDEWDVPQDWEVDELEEPTDATGEGQAKKKKATSTPFDFDPDDVWVEDDWND